MTPQLFAKDIIYTGVPMVNNVVANWTFQLGVIPPANEHNPYRLLQSSVPVTTPYVTAQSHPGTDYSRLHSMVGSIRSEIQKIRTAINDQQEMLEKILSCISHEAESSADVEIEEISDAVARDRIVALFSQSGASPLFYDEISDRLSIPLRQAVEVCNQLESEGLIGEPAGK